MRVRNIKYVSVRLRAWSRVKGKAERERNGRGLLSFFSPLPSLSFFLSFFLFVRSNYSSGWIVINVITPSTTTEKLRAGDRIGWKRNNGRGGRGEISRSVFRSAGYLRAPLGHPMRVLQKARSKRQREEVDRSLDDTYLLPAPRYISSIRVYGTRFIFDNHAWISRLSGGTLRKIVVHNIRSFRLLRDKEKSRAVKTDKPRFATRIQVIRSYFFSPIFAVLVS